MLQEQMASSRRGLIIFVLGFAAGILALNVYRGFARRWRSARSHLSRWQSDCNSRRSEDEGAGDLRDTREQLRAVRTESEPKMNEIRRQADGRLQTVLTPEQWQQFQSIRDEMRHRRGGRGGPRRDRP